MQTFVTIPLRPRGVADTLHRLVRQATSDHRVKTIAEIQCAAQLKDHMVSLRGHIKRQVRQGLYEFSDGSGTVYLDLSRDTHHKLSQQLLGETMLLEVRGFYIDEVLSHDRIKVTSLEPAQ